MKTLMMRGLLLFAALGYFLAALHTYQHHHVVDALHTHNASAPSEHASDHDCPIFTAHSLSVATLPPPEFTAPSSGLQEQFPLPCEATAHRRVIALLRSTRAPPIT